MGIKKRNKVSAEFSMSSLTDIIFLLLIFFMLTSSLVSPNGMNLRLPGTSHAKITTPKKTDKIRMKTNGRYLLNGKKINLTKLESALAKKAKRAPGKLNVILAPDKGAVVEDVIIVMDICMNLGINGILAADK